MKRSEAGGEIPPQGPGAAGRAEAAALAAKVAALAERPAVASAAVASGDRSTRARQASRPHGWLWWTCHSLLWAAMLALATIAALRILFHDGTYFLTWFNAFTRYLYLPAYPALIWAAWQRRWWLAVVSLLIVGCHLVWMAPNFLRDRRFDLPPDAAAATASSPTLRVFFANVLGTNHEFDALFDEIAAADPDIVALAELTGRWRNAVRKSPVMAPYLHGAGMRRSQMGMLEIFSKRPLKTEMRNLIAGRVVQTADIQLGSQTLRLVALHAPRPVYIPEYDYAGYWSQMIPLLATESGPLLVIGDFNATEHSLVYKRLRSMGLRSAHDDRGRGYATTWPNGQHLMHLIRIDQAFVSPEVECKRIVEGRGKGSDHKPLIVDVQIRDHAE